MSKQAESWAVQGGQIEFGQFTLDPASINDNAQGTPTVTITGAKTGDLIFVNAEVFDVGIMPVGAKVTSADTVTLYINNESGGSVDGASKTWDYMLVHRT